jgi:hypothetical protein
MGSVYFCVLTKQPLDHPKTNNTILANSCQLERQYLVFIVAAAAGFAALIVFGFFNPLQQSEGDEDGNGSDVIKARKGEQVFLRYSPAVVKLIQDLPNRNTVEVEVSSELHSTNLAGLGGEIRYTDMEITYVEDGQEETIDAKDFNTIEYRFFPDTGNKTRYVYENVDYIAKTTESQVIVAVRPLSTAEVGEQYTVRLLLHTGGIVNYAIGEKIIEIVP